MNTSGDASPVITVGSIVLYELHGQPVLAVVSAQKKSKFTLLNESGGQLELPADRLFVLPGELPTSADSKQARTQYLRKLRDGAKRCRTEMDLHSAWEIVAEETESISERELAQLLFASVGIHEIVAMREALL